MSRINAEWLYDLFVASEAEALDIAGMDIETATQHISELRSCEPDSIEMSDEQIAQAILEYAQGEKECLRPQEL